MKQTLTIMAIVMVALLVVSGFIVTGSMRQQEQLTAKVTQVNELRTQFKELQEQYDLSAVQMEELNAVVEQQKTTLVALNLDKEDLITALSETEASAAEANEALVQKELELASFQTERDALELANGQQKSMINDLGAKLTEAEKARDEAQTEVKTLQETAQAQQLAVEQASTSLAGLSELQEKAALLETENEQNKLLIGELQTESEQDKLLTQSLQTENEQNKLLIGELQTENEQDKLLAQSLQTENEQNKLLLGERQTESEQDKLLIGTLQTENEQNRQLIGTLQTEIEQNNRLIAALQTEMQAYMDAVNVIAAYENGTATAAESREAVQAFEEAYPSSLLKLPQAKAN